MEVQSRRQQTWNPDENIRYVQNFFMDVDFCVYARDFMPHLTVIKVTNTKVKLTIKETKNKPITKVWKHCFRVSSLDVDLSPMTWFKSLIWWQLATPFVIELSDLKVFYTFPQAQTFKEYSLKREPGIGNSPSFQQHSFPASPPLIIQIHILTTEWMATNQEAAENHKELTLPFWAPGLKTRHHG